MKSIKQFFKKKINLFGFDIVRINQVPQHTFMGLKKLPIKTIIDIGANIGSFAQMVSKAFPDAHIYCFEPLPDVYQDLLKYTQRSENKITAYNLALGENEGILTMHYHVDHQYSSSLLKTTKYSEGIFPQTGSQIDISVKQTTLDKWMENFLNTPKLDILIKIDVQGYEDRVIRGGLNLFKIAKACILEINLASLYYEQASFRDIFLLFDRLGYSYSGNFDQICDKDGKVLYVDSLFLRT